MEFFKPKWYVMLSLAVLWFVSGFILLTRLYSSGCLMLYDSSGNYVGNCGFDYTILAGSVLVLLTAYFVIVITIRIRNK